MVCLSCYATPDTISVNAPQVPILIDRNDNPLFEMYINSDNGDTLDNICIELGKETNLDEIQSIKLYYSGVEAVSKKGDNYKPVNYLSSHNPKFTRKANPSYSIKKEEITNVSSVMTLNANQKLMKGKNFFWISIEMNKNACLTNKVKVNIMSATSNGIPLVLDGDTETERRLGIGVRHAGDDGVAAYRIPGLVTTNKGTLVGTYDVRYNSSVDLQEMIDIGISRSTDKGQTWEPMRIAMSMGEAGGLPHAQNGIGDPSILFDTKNNRLFVVAAWTHGMGNDRAWWNSMPGMEKEETAQLMISSSDDDGKTWSEPVNITKQVKDESWYFLLQGPGRGITMHDGTLVFPIQFIDSTRIPNAGIMYSRDGGKNWNLHNPARSNTTEAQVAEIEPGVLMLNMRDNRGESRAVSITKDLGKTWTEHPSNRKLLQEPVCMASLLKIEADENCLNKEILLFSNPNTTKGRNHITIKASLDNGKSWNEKYQIMLDEDEGWGYSCLTLIDQETIGILYESSVAHMTFQAIKIKDLIRE
ncbi:MAG: sialidase family protein [Parabacteroides sp.]|nr:sialidase family protein [Parabacteroides sp.]